MSSLQTEEGGDECSVNGGGGERLVRTFSSLILRILIDGAVTTETGSLFQHFTTLTENGDPLLALVASPIELTTYRMEALKAQRPYASSLETFTKSLLRRA